jgi:hypothetical protein
MVVRLAEPVTGIGERRGDVMRNLVTRIATAAVLLSLLAACSGWPAPSPGTLTTAANDTVAKGTAKLTFIIKFTGSSSIREGTEMRGAGSTEFGTERRTSLSMDFGAAGGGVMDMIVDGTDAYVRGQTFSNLTGSASRWLYIDLTSDSEMSREFATVLSGTNDTSLLVYYLLGATGEVRQLGTETIDGAKTTRYGTTIDLNAAADRVDPGLRESLEANLREAQASGTTEMIEGEAWIDDDGLLRRIRYIFKLAAVSGGGSMTMTSDIAAHGEPVDLGIPSDDEVVALDDVRP